LYDAGSDDVINLEDTEWPDASDALDSTGIPDGSDIGSDNSTYTDVPEDTVEFEDTSAHDDYTAPDAGPYTGIYEGLDDVTGQALVNAICPLVRDKYRTVSYDNAKTYLREDVDNRGGQIHEIYTGAWFDPDDSMINVEHTWPQSKGAGSAPAQGDMHHLYLSNRNYNSARSNYPYGEVTNATYPDPGEELGDPNCTDRFPESGSSGCFSYVGTDSSGNRVGEPRDAHKGNVARAVFYFQVRYGGSACSLKPLTDFDNYGQAHANSTEAILKDWNRKDPPDADERIRNDRIAAYSNARNPFIDHPEFVDRIDFTP
jgi:endonuclease I